MKLDWKWKGGPVLAEPVEADEFLAGKPSLFAADFLPPVMVMRESALSANATTMAEFCAGRGVELAPHGKTHMAPALAERQLAAGAWGITVATPAQARVYRASGVRRLLLANELVDPPGIAWAAAELAADPEFAFCCYVDSIDGVELLAAAMPDGRPLDVLVEVGWPGGRCGARTVDEAVAIARAAAATTRLRLVGISGYEGSIRDPAQIRPFLRHLRDAGRAIAPLVPADAPFIASAGGSVSFDAVADELRPGLDRPVTLILRSGCYLFHDVGLYRDRTPFGRTLPGRLVPAIEVWASVLSMPEAGLALLGAGRRDVPFDSGLPVPDLVRHADGTSEPLDRTTVTMLNDQHAYVTGYLPFGIGEWVRLGISHPCTAFDKWRLIPIVDDDYRVVDLVRTYF